MINWKQKDLMKSKISNKGRERDRKKLRKGHVTNTIGEKNHVNVSRHIKTGAKYQKSPETPHTHSKMQPGRKCQINSKGLWGNTIALRKNEGRSNDIISSN